MSRDAVAEALEINRTHLDKLCRGTRRPGLALALSIEKFTRGAIPAAEWVNARLEPE